MSVYGSSIGGGLGVEITGGVPQLTLSDPHGDTVTTVSVPATGAAVVGATVVVDEYGNLTTDPTNSSSSSTVAATSGALAYGWLGDHQREIDQAGLTLMGSRLYNPTTGAFTSVDPVPGGNTTDYTYPQDPTNMSDLNGQRGFWRSVKRVWNNPWFQLGLTVATMFIPGGAILGGALWAYRTYKVVRMATAFTKGMRGASAAIRASRPTAAIAGRIYVRAWQSTATTQRAANGSKWIQNGSRGYRSAAKKGRFGYSSNFTHSIRGRHDYRNFHVEHRWRYW